jgi:hypothetical protein
VRIFTVLTIKIEKTRIIFVTIGNLQFLINFIFTEYIEEEIWIVRFLEWDIENEHLG